MSMTAMPLVPAAPRQRVVGATLVAAVLCAIAFVAVPAGAVEVVCHRGANKVAPENTVSAAQQCIDWGVEYVEIDIRTSRDGVLYILHDATVDRTTDGKGRLRDLTSAEIDKLDAGSWFDPKFAGERIPRLEPYLRWIKGKAKIYFDVKDADLEQLIKLVYEVGMENECFFWFGRPDHAARFRQLDKKLALKVNVRTPAQVETAATRLGANLVEVGLSNLTPEMEAACKERKLRIMVIAMEDDEAAFREIIRRKADLVNLDYADVFLKVEKEQGAGSGDEYRRESGVGGPFGKLRAGGGREKSVGWLSRPRYVVERGNRSTLPRPLRFDCL